MKYQLQALGNRVVLQRRLAPEKVGSIIVPERHRDYHAPLEADVISVGEDVKSIDEGDHVIFNEHAGVEIDLNADERYIVLKEEDVLARIVASSTDD